MRFIIYFGIGLIFSIFISFTSCNIHFTVEQFEKIGWFEQGLQKMRKWYESESWGWQDDKYFNIYCPVLNIDYILKFPEYRYSAIDKYRYTDTFKYLRLYEKYPQAEILCAKH